MVEFSDLLAEDTTPVADSSTATADFDIFEEPVEETPVVPEVVDKKSTDVPGWVEQDILPPHMMTENARHKEALEAKRKANSLLRGRFYRDGPQIVDALFKEALKGNTKAVAMILELVLHPVGEPVIKIPRGKTLSVDAVRNLQKQVVAATLRGEIRSSDAKNFSSLLDDAVKSARANETEVRIEHLHTQVIEQKGAEGRREEIVLNRAKFKQYLQENE